MKRWNNTDLFQKKPAQPVMTKEEIQASIVSWLSEGNSITVVEESVQRFPWAMTAKWRKIGGVKICTHRNMVEVAKKFYPKGESLYEHF